MAASGNSVLLGLLIPSLFGFLFPSKAKERKEERGKAGDTKGTGRKRKENEKKGKEKKEGRKEKEGKEQEKEKE